MWLQPYTENKVTRRVDSEPRIIVLARAITNVTIMAACGLLSTLALSAWP
jgi:hypothetical protein